MLSLNLCAMLITHSKSCEAKDNDDEVHRVSQEHQHIDVCHRTVVRVDQVVKELANGEVDLQSSAQSSLSIRETDKINKR